MTPEQKRREKFLRDHGSLPKREQREKFFQRAELKHQTDQLRAQIKEFDGSANQGCVALRDAYTRELRTKLDLLLRVTRGELVSRDAINERTNEVQVLKSLTTKRRFEGAMLSREVR